jgi:hypothetical protein
VALVLLLVVNAATLWQFYQTRRELRQAQSQDAGAADRVAAAFASAANLLADEAESHGRRAEDEAMLAEQAYGAAERAARNKQADSCQAAAQDAANAAERARREAAEAKRIKDALDESGDLAGPAARGGAPAGTGGPPGEAVGRASQAAKAAQEAYQAAQQSAARAASAMAEPAPATVTSSANKVQNWATKAEKEAALAEAAQREADRALKKARDAEDEARKSTDPAAKKACADNAQKSRDDAQSALVEAKASTENAVEALAQADREARANPQDPAVSAAIEKARRARDRAEAALLAAQTGAQQVAAIAERLAAAKPPSTPTAALAELKTPRDRKDKDLADACSVPVPAPDRSGDMATYFVGAADGFVRCEPGDLVGKEDKGKLPEALQRIRYYFEAGKKDKLVVNIPSAGGIGLVGKPLVTCQLKEEAGGRVLECRFEPDFHKAENADYRWLVIEVADAPSKVIYQCLMPKRPAEVKHAVVFGYDKRVVLEPKKEKEKGKGKPEMEKREWLEALPLTGPPLILEYPWPQILTLRLPDGKTPSLAPGTRIALEWQVEKWIYLALEHKSEGGAVQVKPTLSSQGLLDKAASEARPALVQRSRELATAQESQRNAQSQLRGAEARLDKAAEKDKAAIRVQMDDLKTRIKSLDAEIDGHQKAVDALVQPVKDWMDTLNTCLNAKENATLTLRDLWGVPVATLTFKFQPCDPAELIWSKTPPETKPAGK